MAEFATVKAEHLSDSEGDEDTFQDVNEGVAGLSVEESGADDASESDSCLVEKDIIKAFEMKEEGNKYFREKDYDQAIQMYSLAVKHCPEDEENKENLAVFLGNRAAAYSQVEEYDCVLEDCTKSLELKPDYVKVLIRRSQACEKLNKMDEACRGQSSLLISISFTLHAILGTPSISTMY
jgi:import receptor subunit TOM70